jgi:hypothetical protein
MEIPRISLEKVPYIRRVGALTAAVGIALLTVLCSGDKVEGVYDGKVDVTVDIRDGQPLRIRRSPTLTDDSTFSFERPDNLDDLDSYVFMPGERFSVRYPLLVYGDDPVTQQKGRGRWMKLVDAITKYERDSLFKADAPISRKMDGYINVSEQTERHFKWHNGSSEEVIEPNFSQVIKPDYRGRFKHPRADAFLGDNISYITRTR